MTDDLAEDDVPVVKTDSVPDEPAAEDDGSTPPEGEPA